MYVGVEIGGTKLQAALGDGLGTLRSIRRVGARATDGRAAICEQIVALVDQLLQDSALPVADIRAIGIGFGGPVDLARGTTITSHQVKGWDQFPLVEWLKPHWNVDIVLGNDSDLAGLAEAHFGAGKGHSPIFYINIGSGIGGALVIDGRLHKGQGTGSAEIGHWHMPSGDPAAPWQTLEALASGWSLANRGNAIADRDPHGFLGRRARERSPLVAQDVVDAVRANDPDASRLWSDVVELLGVAIANAITLIAPRRIVVGGGVAQVGDLLFEPLRRAVRRHVFSPFANLYEILPAALGEEVVPQGALKLARDHAEGA